MTPPFNPGDVVVCVDASGTSALQHGKVYRVHAVGVWTGYATLSLEGGARNNACPNPDRCHCIERGECWKPSRFRKFDQPDAELADFDFLKLMGARA